jgi:ABC-type polysaccharide/polyol phosphate export permease
MKFNLKTIVSNLQHHVAAFVSALLITAVIWQGAASVAIASPLLGTSANSISKMPVPKEFAPLAATRLAP